MAFTVVPLHNLRLAEGTCIPFGDGLCLQDVPEWLRKDEHTLADINRMDRQLTLAAKHALVAALRRVAALPSRPYVRTFGIRFLFRVPAKESAMRSGIGLYHAGRQTVGALDALDRDCCRRLVRGVSILLWGGCRMAPCESKIIEF